MSPAKVEEYLKADVDSLFTQLCSIINAAYESGVECLDPYSSVEYMTELAKKYEVDWHDGHGAKAAILRSVSASALAERPPSPEDILRHMAASVEAECIGWVIRGHLPIAWHMAVESIVQKVYKEKSDDPQHERR